MLFRSTQERKTRMKNRTGIIVACSAAIVTIVVATVWAATCTVCGGSGVTAFCRNCNGTGGVIMMVQTPMGPMQQTAPCPACVQRGLMPRVFCTNCMGTGQVAGMPYSPSFGGEHTWYCSDCKGKCTASTRYDFKCGECQKCHHPAGHHR